MNWLLSLVVAVLCAAAGCVGGGFVAHVFTSWFRVTSREGAAGYFLVALALLGLIGGFVIGLVCARVVAGGDSPGFLKALGLGVGVTAGVLVLALGFGWLKAEFPPRIDGRELMLNVEARFPPAIPLPDQASGELYRWHVTLSSYSGSRRQTMGELQVSRRMRVDGRDVAPASVYLATADAVRTLGVGCGEHGSQYFDLPLPARPTRSEMEWSGWLAAPFAGDRSPIPAEKAVAVRYRVQYAESDDGAN